MKELTACTKHSRHPSATPRRLSGKMMRRNTRAGVAPRLAAASSQVRSRRPKPAISASAMTGIRISVSAMTTPVKLFVMRIGVAIIPRLRKPVFTQPLSPSMSIQPNVRTTELTRRGEMVSTTKTFRQGESHR